MVDWDFRRRAIEIIGRGTIGAYPEEIYRALSVARQASAEDIALIRFWRRQIEHIIDLENCAKLAQIDPLQ